MRLYLERRTNHQSIDMRSQLRMETGSRSEAFSILDLGLVQGNHEG